MPRTSLALIAALTALGFMLIGYDNGVLGGVINGKPFQDTFKNPTASKLGTLVAIYEIGCCVGALITSIVGESLGRKRTITIGGIIMLGGAAGQAASSSYGPMIASRIISGLGMGAINSTCPIFMAEVSPKASRGRFVAAQLSTLNLGIFLALLSLIVRESPRWDVSHGNNDRAIETLSRLHGLPATDSAVLDQYQEILAAVQLESSVGSGSWKQIFSGRDDEIKSRRRLFIACFIQAAQQLGGINGIIYYAGTLLATTGLDNKGSSLVAGLLFTWFFVASFIPWFIIDRFGRRPLFLVCISLMACCFAAQAGLISKVQSSGDRNAGIAATAVLFLYMGLFTTGFQSTVWCYMSEIMSLRMRQKGSAIATAVNWICNFAIVEMTPSALENIGYQFYIIFAILNAAWVPVIYLFFPETAGKSLEEIDLLFAPSLRNLQEAKDEYAHHEVAKVGAIGEKDTEHKIV